MTVAPPTPSILVDLAMVLGVAALTTVACQRLRLPVVVGYLLAGLIIGPHVPVPLVADPGNVHTLSELGVILLMFSLGLDFSLKKLLRTGPSATLVALIQGGFMAWSGYLVGRFLGWSSLESVFAGAALSISSTMIIARVFAALNTKGPLAELVLSTLIVQDLLAILLLALLTAVGSGAGLSLPALLFTISRLAGFLVVVLALGRWILPRFVRWVADAGNSETLLVTVVGLCFTFSLLAAKAGYSVALGAFLAGMVVAESGRERLVEHLVHPLRDMFVAVFFVSIGMQIDPAQLLPNWQGLLLFGGLVLVGKIISGALGGLLGGHSLRNSIRAGAGLAQIGEFSFIIVALGQSLGVVGPALFPVLAATCAWTTLSTPLLIQHSERVADGIERLLPGRLRHFLMHHRAAMGHLRNLPFRKATWSPLRRPLGHLLLDSLVVILVGVLGALIQRALTPYLETRGLPHRLALYLVWALMAGGALWFSLGILKQVRGMARIIADRATLAAGLETEAVGDAIRLMLELALGSMVALPMAAILQPLMPPGLMPTLVLAGSLLVAFLFWKRMGALPQGLVEGSEGLVRRRRPPSGDRPE
ncbi:MAG: cation:proton antiporter [Holophagaceae bacterium]|uniref:Cation:proton antiporter n=1 Tax=Candidatus Geothrix skivensis TaxID=2954439 RepID=A0A9D7XHW7_9BACT|nr:cation:proton antiporter [Candidatus Geothrix skivensis]